MADKFYDWFWAEPTNAAGEVVFYMPQGGITILSILIGASILIEVVARIKTGKGVFF